MKLLEFDRYFPDEEACRARFKAMRDSQGVVCPKCKGRHHYWKANKQLYQCRGCGYRQSLRANTVMHGSKLPFRCWFTAMHLLTATKHSFSAAELQRQLGRKRYQPIWEMAHKLRSVMGKRNGSYTLAGNVEFDEGFFTTEVPADKKHEKVKRGVGSQRKVKVAVMAETEEALSPKKGQKPSKVRRIKMVVVEDLQADTIGAVAEGSIAPESKIVTDASTSHGRFKSLFREHQSQVVRPEDVGKVLPWVHIAIANSKTLLVSVHHGVRAELLQGYLDEFCYKFNRRYFGEGLFDRLVDISAAYRADFAHRRYGSAA